jgi:CDP-diacylglycerol--glycerol-3-phosphate 3-phosphatidyltransferase
MNRSLLNIPNALSFYRILSFPLVLWFAISHQESLFVIFLMINLLTDILDGYIARRYHLQTEFGARLDSIADIGTYILAFLGIFLFKIEDFKPHLISFYVFIALFLLSNVLSLIKFKRLPSLHLYSWKIGGYIQGFFFFVLFVFNFSVYLYYFMIIWGVLAFIEHIVIQLKISQMTTNAKGLYWLLKDKK